MSVTDRTAIDERAQSSVNESVLRDWLAAATRPGIGAVVALTIAGAALRFINLDYPPLLWDEAATYTRVTGSFTELLAILRHDGFAPLHYELYWVMARFARMSPATMRIVPAIAGVLMIPAIYFLARQVTSRRVATLAAGITAFSAYMLVYSRDAKMYMHLWLCATLFVACLLWWMRTDRRIAWLCFVAAGVAMCGLHALGFCVVGVAVVIVLTHPRVRWKRFSLAIAGMVIGCAPVVTHFVVFNEWGREIQQSGWRRSGLDWIGQRNQRFSKPFLMWDTAASWLLAYRSPRLPITPPKRVIRPVAIVSAVLSALLIAGAMPWPRKWRDDDPQEAFDDAQRGRGVMWMAAWVLLPSIGFYLVSFAIGRDVWNARYLAIVWPAVAVLLALAFQRLPLPWLRAGAIALFIGANLVQFALRMTVENGVPVDLVARDIANQSVATIVAVEDDPDDPSLGGNGGIFDFPGKYYLSLETGRRLRPHQLRDEPARSHFEIRTDLRDVPVTVNRVVVWQDGPVVKEESDEALRILGDGWRRMSSREHAVRDFWCWRRMFRCRRSVYVREERVEAKLEVRGWAGSSADFLTSTLHPLPSITVPSMSLTLRWVGDDERERVAQTRMLCYAPARRELSEYLERMRNDVRTKPGDWLLAEREGMAVGTATSIPLTMWVRGAAVPCQGVAHVGTIKTHRRRSGGGVATALMNETLRAARQRGFVVSALMPFRGSYYEHFGYGFIERRADWKIPMSILPKGEFEDFRFYRPQDFDEVVRFKQRLTERTHGDIERSAALWKQYIDAAEDGHIVVERSGEGPIRSFVYFTQAHHEHRDTVRIEEALYEDVAGLKRILSFVGSMRDQYSFASIVLPAELQLNWLLAETQMTHRQNRNHATAEARPFNRMQVRVLDHAKLIGAMKLPRDRSGKAVVAIHETEQTVSKLAIEMKEGVATASVTDAPADVEMSDRVWSAVVLGDLPATRAAELGLLSVTNRTPLGTLDAFAAGAAPFCREYF